MMTSASGTNKESLIKPGEKHTSGFFNNTNGQGNFLNNYRNAELGRDIATAIAACKDPQKRNRLIADLENHYGKKRITEIINTTETDLELTPSTSPKQ